MKIVCSVMLSCFAAVSAVAADSEEMLRHRLIVQNQFVIEEPHRVLIPASLRCCCRLAGGCDHRAIDEKIRALR